MLRLGVIRPCESAFSAPVLLVKKHSCLDGAVPLWVLRAGEV
jgi:hypothetical protein